MVETGFKLANSGYKFCSHSTKHKFDAQFFFFFFFRAVPAAYGSSQARAPIRATAAGLYHSQGNAGSEPSLQTTPQLTAILDH